MLSAKENEYIGTLAIGTAIIVEASRSFLRLGRQPWMPLSADKRFDKASQARLGSDRTMRLMLLSPGKDRRDTNESRSDLFPLSASRNHLPA
jgi:hypothetical protein